jgi:hypothetical protein
MKTDIFFNAPDSAKLNENFAKQFGGKVNLDKYTREQLEDMRNKIRTRVFQQEGSAGYNDLLTNETYQKDQAMLQLLNTRIKEMLGEDIKQLRDKMVELSEAKKGVLAPKFVKKSKGTKPDFLDMDKDGDKKEPMKKAVADKKVKEGAKPDFLDMDKDGDKKEPMKKAVADKKVKEAFPTVADAKARADKEKTTGKFDKKQTSTGTQYTRKSSTFSDGGDDKDVKAAKKKANATAEGFPTVADAKARADKEKTTGKFDKKQTSTGTQYTRKSNTFTDGGDDADTKKAKKSAKLKEANVAFKQNVAVVNESLRRMIAEDEEGKAKAITAASDMVNDFTSWMQRVGQYQTKAIIELADAIKADFGAQEAETFKQTVAPALSATLETLTAQREAISNAVAVLAGEAAPEEPMGMEPGMDMEPGMEPTEPDMMNAPEMGDEFGASDAAAGGAEPSGREMRESKFARKLAESHSIMAKLAK